MNAPETKVVDQAVAEMTPEQVAMAPFMPDDLPQRTGDLEAEIARARELAESIEVTNAEEARAALEAAKEFKRKGDAIEAERVSLTKPRKDAAEEIKARYDAVKAPFKEFETAVRGRLAVYQAEEDRKAKERQRREEEERRRVEDEARKEREAAEKAEREAAQLAAEAKSKEDAEAAAELAEEARRDAEKAGVTEQAIQSTPPSKPAAAPKLAGFSTPERWEAEVVDFAALPDKLPDGSPLKVIDQVALRRWMLDQVKVNGDVAPQLPGAKFEKRAAGSSVRT